MGLILRAEVELLKFCFKRQQGRIGNMVDIEFPDEMIELVLDNGCGKAIKTALLGTTVGVQVVNLNRLRPIDEPA